jgi:hypothetical protein
MGYTGDHMFVPSWFHSQGNLLLLTALLLCLWLWLLIRRREEDTVRQARPAPLTNAELGRTIFVSAVSNDINTYRGLFLNGREATMLMGGQASSYLDERSYAMLQKSLTQLHRQIPSKAVFDGVDAFRNGRLAIRVRHGDERVYHIRVGFAVQVGSIWRLKHAQAIKQDGSVPSEDPLTAQPMTR